MEEQDNQKPIPRPLLRYKGEIAFGITWIDFGFYFTATILAILTMVFFSGLTKWYIAIWPSVVIGGMVAALCLPKNKRYKLYYWIFIVIKYRFSKKKYSEDEIELLNPYHSITEEGLVKTKDGKYILPIEVKGKNITMLHQSERNLKINSLRESLMQIGTKFSFAKVTTRENYDEHYSYLESLKNNYSKKSSLNAVNDISKNILSNLKKYNLDVKATYVFYVYGERKTLLDKRANIFSSFEAVELQPKLLNSKEIKNIISPFFKHISIQEKNNKSETDLTSLVVGKVEFKHNYIKTSSGYFKIIAISGFPDWSTDAWLHRIANNEYANFIMNVEECDSVVIKSKIDKVIRSLNTTDNSKESQQSSQNRYISGLISLSESLQDKEKVFKTTSLIIVFAESAKELGAHTNDIRSIAQESGLLLEEMDYLQKEAWSTSMPKLNTPLKSIISLEIPSYVLAQTFIFSRDHLNDPKGMYLGYTATNSNVFLDLKVKSKTRMSHAMTIVASKGAGKSTLVKKLMKDYSMQGVRVIGIDYEREYSTLCKRLNGDWINFGTDLNKQSKVLNPLQFYQGERESEEGISAALTTHINFLKTFFEILYPELEAQHFSLLEDAFIMAYYGKGIGRKILNKKVLKNKEFPIMEDVYEIVQKEVKRTARHKNSLKHEWYLKLEILLKAFVVKGTPQNALWNGYTNFDFFDSEFMIMDTHSLIEGGNKKLNSAQYFVMLNHVIAGAQRQKALNTKEGVDKWTMFSVDEAHIFFETLYGAREIARLAKRARKYNLILVLATQNFADFSKGSKEHVAEKMKIIANSQYTFILSMKPTDIADVNDSLETIGGLSESEKNILYTAEQGEGILTINSSTKLNITIDISDEEISLWERGSNARNVKNKKES